MFIPLPIKFHDGRDSESIPFANGLLIAVNALIFWFGWHPCVGPGTGFTSVITYAFGHAGLWHLAANMLTLLVFGTPVNRRLGNGWYLLVYLSTCLAIGILVKVLVPGQLLGASGAIFAIIAIAVILMPSAKIDIAYVASLPATLLVGLFSPPKHWAFWFLRWDQFSIRAWWGLFIIPLLEICGFISNGWNWTNLGHLCGLFFGLVAVLIMPKRLTMPTSRKAAYAF